MPHIIILDENGNEIGRSSEGHRHADESGEEHEPTVVTLNVETLCELHGIKQKKDKDG